MTFEVDYTVLKDANHISVHLAWIDALNVTECKIKAEDIASDLEESPDEIFFHIAELELLEESNI